MKLWLYAHASGIAESAVAGVIVLVVAYLAPKLEPALRVPSRLFWLYRKRRAAQRLSFEGIIWKLDRERRAKLAADRA